MLVYEMPLAEVIYDLYDKLKSVTHGYGTMDYELLGYFPADLVRLDILVAASASTRCRIICTAATPTAAAGRWSRSCASEIDRHLFEIAMQAAIGSRIIARETIAAMRKNVTAKCYGGDITRKRKLWAKQAEGKKRMKPIGRSKFRRRRSWPCSTPARKSKHSRRRSESAGLTISVASMTAQTFGVLIASALLDRSRADAAPGRRCGHCGCSSTPG